MWAHELTVADYQDLIDRGWRRSGRYCYKPIMAQTCCPCYPIRCEANQFRPSRSHKRLLVDVAAFLNTGQKPRRTTRQEQVRLAADEHGSSQGKGNVRKQPATSTAVRVGGSGDQPEAGGQGHDRSRKAKGRRWARKLDHMRRRAEVEGVDLAQIMAEYQSRREKRLSKNREKTLEDLLNLTQPKGIAKHYLELRLVRSSPASPEFEASLHQEHEVYARYQVSVHGDKPNDVNLNQFTRFLVDSPLVDDEQDAGSNADAPASPELGSYHEQYWLDGERLIAVGVVDLLPHCLSSVYCFYDPEFAFLNLGTYSAFREIGNVRQMSVSRPTLQYYYMGFYIHSCPKMRYKGQYNPSYLACPETYCWTPLEICRPLLDANKYARLAANPDTEDENRVREVGVSLDLNISVLWAGGSYPQRGSLHSLSEVVSQKQAEKLRVWAGTVGSRCLPRMVAVVS